jgi:hypothetical protein
MSIQDWFSIGVQLRLRGLVPLDIVLALALAGKRLPPECYAALVRGYENSWTIERRLDFDR